MVALRHEASSEGPTAKGALVPLPIIPRESMTCKIIMSVLFQKLVFAKSEKFLTAITNR